MSRADLPYPLPGPGDPVRLAFVGQSAYFRTAVLSAPAHGIVPAFFEYRDGEPAGPMLDDLHAFGPHVVVCFRPESLPAGTFAGLAAPVVGYIAEPLPRPGQPSHPNLTYNLDELGRLDAGNVDRVIGSDPYGWDAAAALAPMWRCMPLPVDDRLYRAPQPSRQPPRAIFIGHSTMHRERALLGLKHAFDIRHYAHALLGDELLATLHDADAGIVLHGEKWLYSFESRVLLHLAAGHLVFCEPLYPPYGLEAGIEVVYVNDEHDLDLRMHQLHLMPDMYDRIRVRGHHASRQFAASRVWPRLVGDLFADLAAFGTDRHVAARSSAAG